MDTLQFEKNNKIGQLTVNRPKSLNALNRQTLSEMRKFLQVEQDLSVLLLTGAGKAFIAGADIQEMHGLSHKEMLEFCKLGQQVASLLETAPFATIACVNGYALGGGLEMALGCDFIYASREAVVGLPEVTLGLIPGFGGTQRLLRAVGTRKAKELILSGSKISAEKGLELGIINRVYDSETLISESLKMAETIARNSQVAIRQGKRAINKGADMTQNKGLQLEAELCSQCIETEECRAAMTKFLGKNA